MDLGLNFPVIDTKTDPIYAQLKASQASNFGSLIYKYPCTYAVSSYLWDVTLIEASAYFAALAGTVGRSTASHPHTN